MIFAVSEDEFKLVVKSLNRRLPKIGKKSTQAIAEYLQAFMIDMSREALIGCHYDYELQIGTHSIPLDDEQSEELLERLVSEVLTS